MPFFLSSSASSAISSASILAPFDGWLLCIIAYEIEMSAKIQVLGNMGFFLFVHVREVWGPSWPDRPRSSGASSPEKKVSPYSPPGTFHGSFVPTHLFIRHDLRHRLLVACFPVSKTYIVHWGGRGSGESKTHWRGGSRGGATCSPRGCVPTRGSRARPPNRGWCAGRRRRRGWARRPWSGLTRARRGVRGGRGGFRSA